MDDMKGPDYKVWYRPQYLCSVCHICKSIPENGIKCPNCHLVTYCNIEHMEDDQDEHEELCKALKTVATTLGSEHAMDKAYLLGAEQMRAFRLGLITLCSKHLQRQLFPWEMEVCLYPPLCATCYKFHPSKLITCPDCNHTKWCSLQHKPKNHDKYCSQLILYRQILQKRLHLIPSLRLLNLPKNMTQLPRHNDDQIEFCLLTEVATSPLTTLNALPTNISNPNLLIHVIGPEPNFEANNLIKWESFLFDLLPATVKYLHLAFIGPEIGPLNHRTVNKDNRKLEFTFHQVLYHDFVNNNENNETPNLIVAFNPGLYRNNGFQNLDTWTDTIIAMFSHPFVPVLITAYTKKEIILDYNRVKDDIKKIKVISEPSENPFSSQRPLMNFVSDEIAPVVYKNAYHTILSI